MREKFRVGFADAGTYANTGSPSGAGCKRAGRSGE